MLDMGDKVVNKSQVKKALKIKGPIGTATASIAMAITGLNRINRIFSHISAYRGIEFADNLIKYLNVKYNVDNAELGHIPKEGPFIIVSNHPYGAIDGIIILSMIGKIRPDIKILTNFLLSYIPNLEESFFPVNPFTDRKGLRSSVKGLKMAKEHLERGGALALFPAGEVSSNNNKEHVVKDIEWQPSVIKLIKRAEVPVIPLFFSGQNSALFHFLGKIHPLLRTVRLPHELSNKRNKEISLSIGMPINSSELVDFASVKELGRYLWSRTYSLEANICESEKGPCSGKGDGTVAEEPVMEPLAKELLKENIEKISEKRLFEVANYECYLADYKDIPYLMQELGIRRELAFRGAAEGTGKPIDTDDFDPLYKHLILWDKEKFAVAGAYRLGFAKEILKKYGVRGLYTETLFRYKPDFVSILENSIELGRSFVSVEYQKDPLALILLIKGLFYTVIKYSDVKYLLGPVSISSGYPLFYRSIMIYYLQKCYGDKRYADQMIPLTPFVPDYKKVNPKSLLESKMGSLERFDRFLSRMSCGKYRLPTLLKKYLKINARLLAFNVDPDFNNCVDGLIMLNLFDVPKSEIDALSKEFDDKNALYRRFDIYANSD